MVKENHRAKKRFGQNFLHDNHVIEKIITIINPQQEQVFIEIGPGLGALTEPLLKLVPHLRVIEIDRDLVAKLNERFNLEETRITIYQDDALSFDFSSLQEESIRIIGNLPYNISTPLLFHLLNYASQIQDMTFMLQKEVVERICASPGNKQYGRLSVMMQYACEVKSLFTVKPGSFHPAPKVDSAIIQIVPKKHIEYPALDTRVLSNLVREAFSQRRKTLRNALRHIVSEEQFLKLGMDPGLRAENLAIKDFVQLSNLVFSDTTHCG